MIIRKQTKIKSKVMRSTFETIWRQDKRYSATWLVKMSMQTSNVQTQCVNIVQLVERSHVRLWKGRSEVQILCWSNRTQSCQRLATAATFLRKELSCPHQTQ